jgi:hypothetical protein
VESLALVFSSGWASGVNSYLVLLVLGLAERFGTFTQIPDVLGSWEVLAAAAFMFTMEFVADKIPYVDSTWDAISTAIRPTIGAVVGVLLAGEADSLNQAVAGVVGGTSALAAHSVKSGSRLALNVSPEPFTNILASLAEDSAVFVVMLFALHHPYIAASLAATLLVIGLVVLWFAIKLVRKGWRKWKQTDRRLPATA